MTFLLLVALHSVLLSFEDTFLTLEKINGWKNGSKMAQIVILKKSIIKKMRNNSLRLLRSLCFKKRYYEFKRQNSLKCPEMGRKNGKTAKNPKKFSENISGFLGQSVYRLLIQLS